MTVEYANCPLFVGLSRWVEYQMTKFKRGIWLLTIPIGMFIGHWVGNNAYFIIHPQNPPNTADTLGSSASPAASTPAFDEDQFCSSIKAIADKLNREGQVWISDIQRQDGMAVFCSLKAIVATKFVAVNPDARPFDWDAAQTQWNSVQCASFADAIKAGWQMRVIFNFADGTTHQLTAHCQ
jgi:hypothetical protein